MQFIKFYKIIQYQIIFYIVIYLELIKHLLFAN